MSPQEQPDPSLASRWKSWVERTLGGSPEQVDAATAAAVGVVTSNGGQSDAIKAATEAWQRAGEYDEPAAQPPPSVIATLQLRLPDGEIEDSRSVKVTAEPGGHASILGILRNESRLVDNYELTIRRLPEGWWTVKPPVAHLMPYGDSGTYENEIEARLHPPKGPDAHAGDWPFEVIATSRAYAKAAATAPATLKVTPYLDISAEVKPDRVTGRWRARYMPGLTVRNTSNTKAEVALRGQDTDASCRFSFPQKTLTVPAGEERAMSFTVRPPNQIWIGNPVERQLSMVAELVAAYDRGGQPLGIAGRDVEASCKTVFRQRAWLPKWVAVVLIILLLIAAVAVGLIWDKNKKSRSPSPPGQGTTSTSPT